MDLRRQELLNTHNLSEQSLRAKLQDREAERTHRRLERRALYIFTGFIVGALLVIMGACLYMNKDAFALETLKAVLYVVPSLAGGYFAGKQKAKQQEKEGAA